LQYNEPSIQYRELVESSIIDKIIADDIATDVNSSKFKNLMKDINNYIGNELVVSKLENKQITRQTAKNYISLMQYAQLIHLLPRYEDKNDKINTKIYFEDKSMLYFFNGFSQLDDNTFGSLIENVIFNYLIRKYANKLQLPNIFYYRGKNKKEIDFLIEDQKVVIECKYQKNINVEELTDTLNATLDDKFNDYRKIVITKDINEVFGD
jgi:predicted AAA+ superfamily ATPase